MLTAAEAHLGWLQGALAGRACVLALCDARGRVLHVETTSEGLPAEVGILPGAVRARGRAALGKCLASGRIEQSDGPLPVLGWARPSEWALPLRDHDGDVIGVLLVALDAPDAPPGLSLLLGHVGWSIERSLPGPISGTPTAVTVQEVDPAGPQPGHSLFDDVLRVVAHDLRNPLSVIMMGAGVLTIKGAARNDPKLESILLAAERMEQLIRNLTDLTTLAGGSRRVQREAVSLHGLFREAARQPSVRVTERHVLVDDDSGWPLVRVEPELFVQALAGLMTTAAALGAGHLQWQVAPAPRRVRLTVTAGEAVWDEAWAGLLELPLRERVLVVPGAGLGFSLAAAIAGAHAGAVGWARPGSCALTLTLPTAD